MSTAVLPLPVEIAQFSRRAHTPSKKPSRRKPSKSRLSADLAAEKPNSRKSSDPPRHRDSPITAKKINRTNARKSGSRDLVMEEVRILKRGEAVGQPSPPLRSSGDGLGSAIPCLTDRLGPDPKVLPKKISVSAYAGPAFVSSPSPSSLPFPSFFKKSASCGNDFSARSIMCLLRLDANI